MKFSHYSVILFILLVAPFTANAARVEFVVAPTETPEEVATVVDVRLDTQGEQLNAIEGGIGLYGEGLEYITAVEIETGGSDVTLWASQPEFSSVGNVIRFTGGSVESFPNKAHLFRVRIISEKQSSLTMSWIGGSAHKNDGEGTPEGVSSRSLTIAVSESIPNQMLSSSIDTKAPQFKYIEVSRDPTVFEGAYFVSFAAVDDVSGIDRYVVVEGQTTTEVTNGIYQLRDQNRKEKVVIIAYDKAGNSNSIKVPTKYSRLVEISIVGVMLLLMLFVVFRRVTKVR